MKCPRDGSPLNTEKYEAQIEVDACPTCHGVWLDKGELEQIQETTERDYEKELHVPADRVSASIAESRRDSVDCPKCGTRLATREYAYCSSVFVDACPEGCGMWLDEGELQELEKFFEREQQTSVAEHAEYLWVSLLSVFQRRKKKS
jgi:Zn-finger nucleic acid-binding protein